MGERGASQKEVIESIQHGENFPAKHGRMFYRKNFQYNRKWAGKFYHIKQVTPVIKKQKDEIIVITVYTFYF
jgi:hypothetical protein